MEDGSWFDVATRKNALVVNLGETLSRMTGRKVKATIHRVLTIGRPRQSVPFFLEPAYHARVPNSLPEEKEEELTSSAHPVANTFEYGQWLRTYIKKFVEYQSLDDDS